MPQLMRLLPAALALQFAAAPVFAQTAAPTTSGPSSPTTPPATFTLVAPTPQPATPTAAATPAGPRLDAARVGISSETKTNKAAPDATSAAPQHLGQGRDVALMVVGGAALITGLIIGGDGGTLLAIGGAVVGLFGLFNFVQ